MKNLLLIQIKFQPPQIVDIPRDLPGSETKKLKDICFDINNLQPALSIYKIRLSIIKISIYMRFIQIIGYIKHTLIVLMLFLCIVVSIPFNLKDLRYTFI